MLVRWLYVSLKYTLLPCQPTVRSQPANSSWHSHVLSVRRQYHTPLLMFKLNGVNELNDESSALEWDSTAEQVRVALQALDSICGDAGSVNSDCYNTQARQVEVTRTGDGTKTSNYGYTFSISWSDR